MLADEKVKPFTSRVFAASGTVALRKIITKKEDYIQIILKLNSSSFSNPSYKPEVWVLGTVW